MAFTRTQLEQFAAKERDRYEEMLKDFVRCRASPPTRAEEGRRAGAELGAATIRASREAELHRVPGGTDRLGAFGEEKGRPPSPSTTTSTCSRLEGDRPWTSEPFTFTKEGDKYLGRGTTMTRARPSPRSRARAATYAGSPSTSSSSGRRRRRSAPRTSRDAPEDRPAAATDAVSSPTPCGCRAGGPRSRRACASPADHLPPRDGRDRPALGQTGAPPATRGELAQIAAEIFDARTAGEDPRLYDDVEKLTAKQIADFKAADSA